MGAMQVDAGSARAGASAALAREGSLQGAFRSAAREFGVPERVLLSVSYHMSRWEHHGGAPSTSGGYGPMHLTDVDSGALLGGRGEGARREVRTRLASQNLHTLDAAARLLGVRSAVLKRDPAQNIRGGAALLATYARDSNGGRLPARAGDWYAAVARYSGSDEGVVAREFAELVYATIRQGAAQMTRGGDRVRLLPAAIRPNRATARALSLREREGDPAAECPDELGCRFIPAAYAQNDPNNPTDYGNYDIANRERDGLDIRYIVIHDTEIPYSTTIQAFQNPQSYVSSHYVLRSADGEITQMVHNKDVSFTAGNFWMNMHGINLEHEGVAIEGAAWYSEPMYRASAKLVRYLAKRYGIPRDRAHIIGHDDVPAPIASLTPGMHWDPGPYWDWEHYMDLVGRSIRKGSDSEKPGVVTIKPDFEENTPTVSYCFGATDCREVPKQPASFVPLYTSPSFDAPLLDDPGLPGPGTTRAYDWGDKASTGQQFYRFGKQGDWDAIWFGGQIAWFHNPDGDKAGRTKGTLLRPKAGVPSIPVYGRAFPEASAYPAGITPSATAPLQYSIAAGQLYVATDKVQADRYVASNFGYAPSASET